MNYLLLPFPTLIPENIKHELEESSAGCSLLLHVSGTRHLFSVRVLISANQFWSMHTTWLLIMSPTSIQQAKKTCNLPERRRLSLGFHYWSTNPGTKSSPHQVLLFKNMHFHLFIGYMATITFQFKNVAIVKQCFTDWRFRLSVVVLWKGTPYICM